MHKYISLVTCGWITLSKLYCTTEKFNVINNIMSSKPISQPLTACETKTCNCTRCNEVTARSEGKSPYDGQKGTGVEELAWRRHCGCIRTSEKLRKILKSFPSAPPPSPVVKLEKPFETCMAAYCAHAHGFPLSDKQTRTTKGFENEDLQLQESVKKSSLPSGQWWRVVSELVRLVQLSVTATALALYYLIYCYMQLVYYTLRSALYFHNADGPMKITIGVVTVTSLIVGFNLVLRMEKMLGIF